MGRRQQRGPEMGGTPSSPQPVQGGDCQGGSNLLLQSPWSPLPHVGLSFPSCDMRTVGPRIAQLWEDPALWPGQASTQCLTTKSGTAPRPHPCCAAPCPGWESQRGDQKAGSRTASSLVVPGHRNGSGRYARREEGPRKPPSKPHSFLGVGVGGTDVTTATTSWGGTQALQFVSWMRSFLPEPGSASAQWGDHPAGPALQDPMWSAGLQVPDAGPGREGRRSGKRGGKRGTHAHAQMGTLGPEGQ